MGLQMKKAFPGELVGLWSIGLKCLKGAGQWSGHPVCVWIASLAVFKGMVPEEIMQACAWVRGAA
jgi:hypothetical protein